MWWMWYLLASQLSAVMKGVPLSMTISSNPSHLQSTSLNKKDLNVCPILFLSFCHSSHHEQHACTM